MTPYRKGPLPHRELDTARALESLAPEPAEYAVWVAAAGRWGLAEPSPDDVLSEHYGTARWDQLRPGLPTLLSGMAGT